MKVIAIPFKQDGVRMYACVMRAADVLAISEVDVWRQEDGQERGYQRAPETGRMRRVAQYLQGPRPLMPTSILLSARWELEKRSRADGTVELFIPEDLPSEKKLKRVDGQHRLGGFEVAIYDGQIARLADYPLAVVIMEGLTEEQEAEQFRIINETMKKVRTDLARRILAARLQQRGGRRELTLAGRLWEAVAVDVMRLLNEWPDSPWHQRIQPPNVRKQPQHIVREVSFTTSLKPVLTTTPYKNWPAPRIARWLKEYWTAWQQLVPDAFEHAEDYVLLKTPGVFSLHQVALHIFELIRNAGIDSPTAADFLDILKDLGQGEDDCGSAHYWQRENMQGAAAAGSMKGFSLLAELIIEELKAKGHDLD